jgi:hypothetical protein
MFKKKWPRRIVSDSGFELQVKSRGSLLYIEGNKTLEINSEYLAHSLGIVIYKKYIKNWEKPYEKESITEEKREEIINNVKEALAFKKIDTEIL